MNLPKHLLPTTVVGSYPQPEWLVDRAMLSTAVPRTRLHAMWRLPAEHLEEAQDDATIVAIRDMERAGIDIVTDGEIRRESYSNRFATALEGIDVENPAMIISRSGLPTPVPRVVGTVKRRGAVELHDMEFLRKNTDRAAKITLPGPFTMSQQAKNEFYEDDEELAMAFAAAVNAEALDLQKAGADVIQLDEPWVRNNPDLARRYAVKAINRALEGITVPTVVHLCFGYAAVVPVDQAGRLFLPRRTRRYQGRTDFDRGGAAEARPRRAQGSVVEEDHARRARPRQSRDRIRHVVADRNRRAEVRRRGSPGRRARLRHEIYAARGSPRKTQGDVRRGGDRPQGAQLESGPVIHQGQKPFQRILTTRPFQMDGFTGKAQPIFSLGQPIDLAVRFAASELPAKCRPDQLKLVDHAVSPAKGGH